MLTGTLPFESDSISSLFAQIKSSEFQIPFHLSEKPRDLLLKMLESNPLKRIRSQELIRHPW
jgi:serine/threonine protein kinase